MRLPAFPRPALLPWLLALLSTVMLVTGIVRGDGVLVSLAILGIAVGLLSYPLAKLILGSSEDRDPADALPPAGGGDTGDE